MRKIFVYGAFVVVAAVLGFVLVRSLAQPKQLTAYVASSDRRIYVVDIGNGAVLATSDPIDGLGAPTSVEMDQGASILYVGSERGRQNDYYPLVAVSLNDNFAVAGRYTLNPARDTVDNAVMNPDVHAVLAVNRSRSRGRLFLSYAAPGHGLATEFDVATKTIIRELNVPVTTANSILSADGRLLAEVWPSGSRTTDGVTTQWPGGVGVREIATGRVVSKVDLVNDQGLQPPWEKLASPFVYLDRGQNLLRVYDRESGRRISSLNLVDLTGLSPTGGEPRLVEGSTQVVLTMIKPEKEGSPSGSRGFVVVIDFVTGKVVHAIEVGPEPTDLVWVNATHR